jgi:hypothetical protein
MTDPTRLVDRLGTGEERDLLRLGANERAPRGARHRVEARVLAAAAFGAATTVAAATGASGGKGSSALGLLVLKWLSIGALAGGVTAIAGSEIAFFPHAPAKPVEAAVQTQPAQARAPVSRAGAPAAKPETPDPPSETSEGRAAPSASKRPLGDVRIGTSSTLVEAESMRRIRVESARDPAQAKRLIQEHLARFPKGAHAAEAEQLWRKLSAKRNRDPN